MFKHGNKRLARLHKYLYMRLFRTDDEIHLGSSFKAFTFPKNLNSYTQRDFFLSLPPPSSPSLIVELKTRTLENRSGLPVEWRYIFIASRFIPINVLIVTIVFGSIPQRLAFSGWRMERMLRRDLRMFLFDSTRNVGEEGIIYTKVKSETRGKQKKYCVSRGKDSKRREALKLFRK